MLVRLLYVSVIDPGLAASDIQRLVASSRRRNRQLDLTGALLVCDGHFVQVLEGNESAVADMMANVEADTRHRSMQLISREETTRRSFADWDMGFVDEAACNASIHELMDGRMDAARFMELMHAWIQDEKEAPY